MSGVSFDFESPKRSVLDTFGGGEAGLGAIWRASRDAAEYIDNTFARGRAVEEAYKRRIQSITDITGAVIDNPSRTAFTGIPDREELSAMQPGENRYDAAKRKFRDDLAKLAEQFPEHADIIGANRPIEEDAREIARTADEELARVAESRTGLLKWGALLGGGIAGSLRDPVQLGTIVLGGGPGGARTVGGRILAVTAKEALINGAVEAGLQPNVQAWRREAGLSAGFDEAIRNVLFAAGLGAGFGGAVQGGVEAAGRVLGRELSQTDALARELSRDTRLPETTRLALDGDTRAAVETLRPIRDDLPAAARGALDAAEDLDRLETVRPKDIAPPTHEIATARAEMALDAGPQAPLTFDVDAEQLERITERLMPAEARPATKNAPSLTEFLARAGGIDAAEPEIRASDLSKTSVPFVGRLSKEGGMKLDQARELAAQNGYLWEFGNIDEATASTTPDDLVQALFREARGERITPFETMEAGATAAEFDAARREVEDMANEVLSRHGPGLPDDRVIAAMEIMRDESVPAEEALTRLGGGERTGEPKPGYDDESLLAAAENRPAEPSAEAVSDPFEQPDAVAITDAELEEFGDFRIPAEDYHSVLYQRTGYGSTNRFLRTGKVAGTLARDDIDAIVESLDSRMVLFDAPTSYRGTTRAAVEAMAGKDFAKIKPGDILSDKAYLSVSSEERIARQHFGAAEKNAGEGGGVMLQIEAGTVAAHVPAASPEGEMIIARGSDFRVAEVAEIDGVTKVRLEPLDPGFSKAEIEKFGAIDIPAEDGELVPLSAYLDEINRADDYAVILEACRA